MHLLIAFCAIFATASAGLIPVPVSYVGAPPATAVSYSSSLPVYVKPFVAQSHYRTQNTLGQYSYGFASTDGISKSEARNVDGSITGGYSYTAPDGQKVKISYTAGEEGFKASGDAIPQPVEPTAEVKEATEKHEAAILEAEAKAAKEAEEKKTVFVAQPPVTYTYPYGYYYSHPPSYSLPHYYKFPIVSYKTVVPVTEVKPISQQSHSYSFTS